jgi:phosphoribosyl 1,2-cyclic phosphodiesterase
MVSLEGGPVLDGTGFFVKFWGTRGSIPTPGPRTRKYGGNTSCVEIRVDNNLFICDGGTGLRDLGIDLEKRDNGPIVGHMFFSHPHWDHIQGFPFFTPAYKEKNTFFIYGTSAGDRRIYDLLSGQMQSDYFPVSFTELGASILASDLDEQGHSIAGVKVTSYEQAHPGRSFAFAFERDGVKVIFATDNELDMTIENPDEVAKDFTAQRKLPRSFLDFCRGADLLIADGQYTEDEYEQKRGWGHARATTVVDAAVQAGVKQLAIFHHDPMHGDDEVDQLIDLCRARAAASAPDMTVFGAREGMELKLD